MRNEGKEGWTQGQVELEGFLGFVLPSILESKYVGTEQTSFANLVSSTIVVNNRVELETVDPGMWVDSQATMASQVHKKTPQDLHSYRWLINWEMMDIYHLNGLMYRSHKLKCYLMGTPLRNASSCILGNICSLLHFPPHVSFLFRVSNWELIILKIYVSKFSKSFPISALVIPPKLIGFKFLY